MTVNSPVIDAAHRVPWRCLWPGGLALVLVWVGCRTPDTPVITDRSQGLIYDTAMEAEIRRGDAPALVQTAYAPYVDTLAEPVAITDWKDETCQWEVFVATNRGRWEGDDNRPLLTPAYGRAEVVLTRQQRGREPKVAGAKSPLAMLPVSWRRQPPEDESGATAESTKLTEAEFLQGVSRQIERSRQHDLLIFVHGFNVNFDAAVIRTAQVALDMPFNGAVVAYCWPSQCGVFNYEADEPINRASVEPFTAFLQTLLAGVPAETRISIMVHSMGNRIVMKSLHDLPPPESRKPFANVVLCAPDVGEYDFRNWAPGVVAQADRVTLYASPSDSALIVSKGIHAERRAGDADRPMLVEGIELVDCGRVDLSLMGHSYYGSNVDVLSDLFQLLKENRSAGDRGHLEPRTSQGETYWTFGRSAPAMHWTWHFDEK